MLHTGLGGAQPGDLSTSTAFSASGPHSSSQAGPSSKPMTDLGDLWSQSQFQDLEAGCMQELQEASKDCNFSKDFQDFLDCCCSSPTAILNSCADAAGDFCSSVPFPDCSDCAQAQHQHHAAQHVHIQAAGHTLCAFPALPASEPFSGVPDCSDCNHAQLDHARSQHVTAGDRCNFTGCPLTDFTTLLPTCGRTHSLPQTFQSLSTVTSAGISDPTSLTTNQASATLAPPPAFQNKDFDENLWHHILSAHFGLDTTFNNPSASQWPPDQDSDQRVSHNTSIQNLVQPSANQSVCSCTTFGQNQSAVSNSHPQGLSHTDSCCSTVLPCASSHLSRSNISNSCCSGTVHTNGLFDPSSTYLPCSSALCGPVPAVPQTGPNLFAAANSSTDVAGAGQTGNFCLPASNIAPCTDPTHLTMLAAELCEMASKQSGRKRTASQMLQIAFSAAFPSCPTEALQIAPSCAHCQMSTTTPSASSSAGTFVDGNIFDPQWCTTACQNFTCLPGQFGAACSMPAHETNRGSGTDVCHRVTKRMRTSSMHGSSVEANSDPDSGATSDTGWTSPMSSLTRIEEQRETEGSMQASSRQSRSRSDSRAVVTDDSQSDAAVAAAARLLASGLRKKKQASAGAADRTNAERISESDTGAEHRCRWQGCGQSFSSAAELSSHLTDAHVGSGKSEYICEWDGCERNGRVFTQRQKLCRHLQSHTGDRPHECHICHKRFTEATTLTQHIRAAHTDERPYKCDFPGCKKAFSVAGSLTIHKRTHSGEKPFKCPFEGCDKAFAESSNLSKHVRVHTGARPFVCEECGHAFARPDGLDRHRKVHEKQRERDKGVQKTSKTRGKRLSTGSVDIETA